MPYSCPPDLRLHPDGCTFELLHEIDYIGRSDTIKIPAGFVTDLASIPAVCSWAIPKLGAYSRAAIVHDYLCRCLGTDPTTAPLSSHDTDGMLRRIMRENGVDIVTRWLMWSAVRLGALTDRYRRRGWLQDAAPVTALTLIALPVIGPPTLLAIVGRLLITLADKIGGIVSPTQETS